MARDNPLHDHPRSKKDEPREAKKGDVEVDEDGTEWESQGTKKNDGMDLGKAWDSQKYPRRVKSRKLNDGDKEYFTPAKKEEVPVS